MPPGHDISSSNFRRFVPPYIVEAFNEQCRMQTATNLVYHSEQSPSRIILPVIPQGEAK